MRLDKEVKEDISRAKREVYKRTGASSTRLRQKNKDESRSIRLCNGRDIIYEV